MIEKTKTAININTTYKQNQGSNLASHWPIYCSLWSLGHLTKILQPPNHGTVLQTIIYRDTKMIEIKIVIQRQIIEEDEDYIMCWYRGRQIHQGVRFLLLKKL